MAGIALHLPEPALEDELVRLRAWRDEDADAVARACADPEIARWIPLIPVPYTLDDARAFVDRARRGWADGTEGSLAIADPRTDQVLGAMGVHPDAPTRWSIGYWVAPWARRRGVATHALRLCSRWAMREFALVRVALVTRPGNEASQRTARAAGFRYEGVLRNFGEYRGAPEDLVVFSLIPADLDEE